MTAFIIRNANLSDLQNLVQLHQKSFPGFFLSQLGPGFLSALYRGYLESPDGICLVAEVQTQISGAILGTVKPHGFYRSLLKRRWWAFLAAAIPGLLKNPVPVARKLWGALFYSGDAPSSHKENAALIASIGIHPDQQGAGIGTALLEALFDEARKRGASWAYLTTDREDNLEGNNFYLRAGFQLETSFEKSGGRWMNRYLKPLIPDSQPQ